MRERGVTQNLFGATLRKLHRRSRPGAREGRTARREGRAARERERRAARRQQREKQRARSPVHLYHRVFDGHASSSGREKRYDQGHKAKPAPSAVNKIPADAKTAPDALDSEVVQAAPIPNNPGTHLIAPGKTKEGVTKAIADSKAKVASAAATDGDPNTPVKPTKEATTEGTQRSHDRQAFWPRNRLGWMGW